MKKLLQATLAGIMIGAYAVGTSGQDHTLTGRKFQGIPSLAISPEGRFWTTWYAGITPGEDHNNYVVIATSGDSGKTWTENLIIDPDAGVYPMVGPGLGYDQMITGDWIPNRVKTTEEDIDGGAMF